MNLYSTLHHLGNLKKLENNFYNCALKITLNFDLLVFQLEEKKIFYISNILKGPYKSYRLWVLCLYI